MTDDKQIEVTLDLGKLLLAAGTAIAVWLLWRHRRRAWHGN